MLAESSDDGAKHKIVLWMRYNLKYIVMTYQMNARKTFFIEFVMSRPFCVKLHLGW
jgi:hypothetical protein